MRARDPFERALVVRVVVVGAVVRLREWWGWWWGELRAGVGGWKGWGVASARARRVDDDSLVMG